MKNVISNFKNDFKFMEKSRDLKTLRDSLWRHISGSADVYTALAEGDSFSTSYFLHKFHIFELFSFFLLWSAIHL